MRNSEIIRATFDNISIYNPNVWVSARPLRCQTRAVCVDVSDGVMGTGAHFEASRANALASNIVLNRIPSNVLVSMWVRTSADTTLLQSTQGLVPFAMSINAGKLACSIKIGQTTYMTSQSVTVTDGQWHQLACLVTPGQKGALTSYVDGRVAETVLGGVITSFLPARVVLGQASSTYGTFDVDEFILAGGVVGSSEVLYLYNAQVPVGTPQVETMTSTPSNTATSTRTATATRTATNTRTSTRTITPSATITPVPVFDGGGVVNGDFEANKVGWTERSSQGFSLISNWLAVSTWRGLYFAWLGGADDESSQLEQVVTVPSDKTSLAIHSGYYSNEPQAYCASDNARILINGVELSKWNVCNKSKWSPVPLYSQAIFDLSGYAGQTVTMTLEMQTDESNISSWYIDTVQFVEPRTNTTLLNADFASAGNGDWHETSRTNGVVPGQFIANGVAKLGNKAPPRNNVSDRISQYVTLPADTKRLLFDVTMVSEEKCGSFYDVLNIEVDNAIVGTVDVCKRATGLPRQSIDIASYAGQRVRISFFLTTDGSVGSEARVDNVALSNTLTAVNVPLVQFTQLKITADPSMAKPR